MEVSYRLTQIAELVTEGHRVADVGTDHAYIPIKLILEKKIPSAIAMDIGKGPLQRAILHVRQYHLQNQIECRLSDGLKELLPEETDTIVIAGMGGNLMKDICASQQEQFWGNKEFILQPQSEIDKVRRQMHHMGYQIVEERFFTDDGKFYNCIKAIPGNEQYSAECEYRFGKVLLNQKNECLQHYLQKRVITNKKIKEQIHKQGIQHEWKAATLQKLQELEKEQDILEEALSYF